MEVTHVRSEIPAGELVPLFWGGLLYPPGDSLAGTLPSAAEVRALRSRCGEYFRKLFGPTRNANSSMVTPVSQLVRRLLAVTEIRVLEAAHVRDVVLKILHRPEYKRAISKDNQYCSVTFKADIADSLDWMDECLPSGENCDAFGCFEDTRQHLLQCCSPIMLPEVPLTVDIFSLSLPKRDNFFEASDYSKFKTSLFEDILFVPELRKEMRGAMSSTRRLYAVYGPPGTGMLYSNFMRRSVDSAPTCISLLLHRLLAFGYKVTTNTCIMIACYPPLSENDRSAALTNGKQYFSAMGWHADDDEYLGPIADIEVFTVSGFVDEIDINSPVNLEGWHLYVQKLEGKSILSIPLPDNSLLVQPKGMQTSYRHCVRGIVSGCIRWVVTVREVDPELFTRCRTRQKKVEENVEPGHSLSSWTQEPNLRARFQKPSKPQTHSKLTYCGSSQWPLRILFPVAKSDVSRIAFLLRDWDVLYCHSCRSAIPNIVHNCTASNSVVFGRRNLIVGKIYSKSDLVESCFNGGYSIESSFGGANDIGTPSMYLTSSFPGNDWTHWKDGVIYVGGAGGRERNSDKGIYENTSAQVSSLNLRVETTCHNELPVDVVVQAGPNEYCYIGTWYVWASKLCAGSTQTKGCSFYQFELRSKTEYWRLKAEMGHDFGIVISMFWIGKDPANSFEGERAKQFFALAADVDPPVCPVITSVGSDAACSLGLPRDEEEQNVLVLKRNAIMFMKILGFVEPKKLSKACVITALNEMLE